ncbi:MAG: thiamine diphosphokinase [Ignavibacteria bacterium]|nr:thiamine diphosphokinase [Ignavibacteria bacterium]
MIENFYNINFNELKFDAVVCLDGDLPSREILDQVAGIPVLAADGGAIKLYRIGIIADYVIGDLDSFKSMPESINFPAHKIIERPDQETNDFEKTLVFAESLGYMNLIIFGFHGGLLEHTLNNWSVLIKIARRLNLCVFDNGRYCLPISYSFKIQTHAGEIISLIPQPAAILTTKNLKWELTNEELRLGSREGARNVALSDWFSVEIHSGELLLFIEERLPFAPQKKMPKRNPPN